MLAKVPDDERRHQVARQRAGERDRGRVQGAQRQRGAVEAQLQAAARRRALERAVQAAPGARARLGALAGGALAQRLARRAGGEQVPGAGGGDDERAGEHQQPGLVARHTVTPRGIRPHGRDRRSHPAVEGARAPRARRPPPRCRRPARLGPDAQALGDRSGSG